MTGEARTSNHLCMAGVLKQAGVQLAGFQAVALRMLRCARQLVRPPHGCIGRPVPVLQAAHDGLLQACQLVQLLILVRDCLSPLRLHRQLDTSVRSLCMVTPCPARNADRIRLCLQDKPGYLEA